MAATRDSSEDAFPDRDATAGETWFRAGGTHFERMRDTGAVIITIEYPSGMSAVRELSADDWASLVLHLHPTRHSHTYVYTQEGRDEMHCSECGADSDDQATACPGNTEEKRNSSSWPSPSTSAPSFQNRLKS